LDNLSSTELAEWMAYEKVAGPVGDMYTHEALASIQEHLQLLLKVQTGEEGPDVHRFPRPYELYDEANKKRGDDD
jgi:hypothetical protein